MRVRNDSISDISYTTAKATATIIDPGEGIEQHGHCWSINAESINIDNETKTENGPVNTAGSYSSILTGLSPNTGYYVRAYALKGATIIYGNKVLSFHTLSLGSPDVSTVAVSNITTSGATVSASLNNLGAGSSSVTQHGHCWSSESATPAINENSKSTLGSMDTTGNFESYLISLSKNTLYYVRAYATNNAGTSYGNTINFTTNADFPVVNTSDITSITGTSAQSGGDISDDGGAAVTARGVCWSTSENPDLSDPHTTDGIGTDSFISNIEGLSPNTDYYIRAYATNIAGTAYGVQISFTTSIDLPTVVTGTISSITETSAQTGGNVTSNGGATVTARGVCWSTSENPTVSDSHTTDGNSTGSFISIITELSTNTTYYVRAYATNSTGTGYGNELVFTTKYITISWQNPLGGTNADYAYYILQTTDEGYIIAGYSNSNDGDVSGNRGNSDYWIVKLNSTGALAWQKSFGGSSNDFAYSIQKTIDGGYIIAGSSNSDDGDVYGNHGGEDYWIVKLTLAGEIDWWKSFGGSSIDLAYSIQQTTDGGYIVAGNSCSNDGDVSGNQGGEDYWIVKLTSAGEIDWQKSLGGSGGDYAMSIQQTTDGGYIIAGYSNSNDKDVSGNNGSDDYWIVKLTSAGVIDWQKSLGGSTIDIAYSVQQTTDGGYIIAGYSESNDGDITGHHGIWDYWIVKLTSAGDLDWQKSLGGSGWDRAFSVQQAANGGYIIAGESYSNDGDVTGNQGANDYWIVKLTLSGEIEWQKSLGGTSFDWPSCIQQTTDGSYIISGYSMSDDCDVSGNQGDRDYWIVKLYENF